jgi:hypothetical protein
MTWPRDYYPDFTYVVQGLTVGSNARLTIEPGTVVKCDTGTGLLVYGQLVAEGGVGEEIYFTSLKDDSVGGDTNGDGNVTSPARGDWEYIWLSSGGRATLGYAVVRYGGQYGYSSIQVRSSTAVLTVHHSTVSESSGNGIYIENGVAVTVTDSVVGDNDEHGIYTSNAVVTIRDSTVQNNGNVGIRAQNSTVTVVGSSITGNANFGVQNMSTTPVVQAVDNWWGHPSGPYHPVTNPDGLGNAVSDYVAYDPWRVSPGARESVPLVLGQTVTDCVGLLGYKDYRLVITAGLSLVVEVVPLAGSETLWLYSRLGDLALWTRYDLRAQEETSRGTYELMVSPTQDGTYYFSVYGRNVSATGGNYRMVVNAVERYLSDVSPRSAGNAGEVTLNLSGLPFVDEMGVELRGVGFPTLAAYTVTLVSPTALWAHFDLSGDTTGVYNVVAVWPGGGEASLTGAFTITQGVGPRLETRLVAPEAVRPGRQYVLWLEYANTGDADMAVPLLIISSPQNPPMRLSLSEPYTLGPVQTLGISFDGPAGTLRPGSQYRIPIYFQATNTNQVSFSLEQMVADATPVDWDVVEADFQWEGIDSGVWNSFWQAFVARVGETRAMYLATLGDVANMFSRDGLFVSDVSTLLSALALEVAAATENPLIANEFPLQYRASVAVTSDSEPYNAMRFKTYDRNGVLVDITDLSGEQIRELAPRDWNGNTKLIVHGWNAQVEGDWPVEMGERMRGVTPNDLIVMVDIQGFRTGPRPYSAAGFIAEASDGIAQFWRNNGLRAASTHCIGHSLGAHTCTEISIKLEEWQGHGFVRCSALDAAAIGSRRSLAYCSDTCVDQYKSSILGIRRDQGHVVWSVRGGNHENARVVFYNSIGNQNCAGGFDVGCNASGPNRWKGNLNLDCTGYCASPALQHTEIETAPCADGFCQDPTPNQQPPQFPGVRLDETSVNVIRPRDPNEKTGPEGTGQDRVVTSSDELHYTIYFENVPTAAAPAQQVVIVDNLDPDLDWSTFQVTEIAFGDRVIAVQDDADQFYTQETILDYRDEIEKSWWVDVTAQLNYQTGQVNWTLRTLDPETGESPEDPLAGFLPPNDETGRGEGHVAFSVKPRSGLAMGTVITNQASIVFDTETSIVTNEVWNTVGEPSFSVYLPVVLRKYP